MRPKFIALLSVLFIAGCVPSLHPLWTRDTLVYDETISGRYQEGDNTWQFTGDPNDKSYEIVIAEKEDKKSQLVGHLVRIDGQLFFDFYPSDDAEIECGDWLKFHLLGVHLFFKVEKTESSFSMAAMDPGEVGGLFKEKPDLIEHEFVDDDRVVLTDTPENLQTFLLKGLKIEGFFDKSVELIPLKEVRPIQP